MNVKSKYLADAGWKDLASKSKVKDNGLVKALEKLKRVDNDAHEEQGKTLDEIIKLAGQLKKDKAIVSLQAVSRYLAEVQADAEATLRDVAKAKAEHEKAQKAKAEAEKKAAARQDDDEDDDDEPESPELLTTKLKPLLKLVAKGETMHALLAKSGKQVVVMLSRKPIPPARRKLLAEQLGGGSTKYYPGTCGLERGATTFALKAEVAGMSKLVKAALLEQTGIRLNKIKCRGEDGDDDDDDDAGEASGPDLLVAKRQPTDAARDAAPPPAAAPAAPSAAPAAAPAVASSPQPADLLPAGEMKDEEVAAHIVDKQIAILQGWETALQVFDKTMTSDSDKEAEAKFQDVVIKHFTDKLVGELLKRAPLATEIKALADKIDGEIQRAAKAQASATLRDFVNQHAKAIGKLVQSTLSQRQGFISAVRKRREQAGVDEPSRAAPKGGKPKDHVEVNPKHLDDWTQMRMALMDTLEAVDRSLGDATPEKLMRVLTEAWIRQGTTGKIAGKPIQAVVLIKLEPDYSVRGAHIQGSGGQKLAEQLLKDSPAGVDVYGLKTPKRIMHYADNNWPEAALELDADNRDVTPPAGKYSGHERLKKYLASRGLPPTKKLTGD